MSILVTNESRVLVQGLTAGAAQSRGDGHFEARGQGQLLAGDPGEQSQNYQELRSDCWLEISFT